MINRSNVNFKDLIGKIINNQPTGGKLIPDNNNAKPIIMRETKSQRAHRKAPEILFRPDNLGEEFDSKIKESINSVIDKLPINTFDQIDENKEKKNEIVTESKIFNTNTNNNMNSNSNLSVEVPTHDTDNANDTNNSMLPNAKLSKKSTATKKLLFNSITTKQNTKSETQTTHEVEDDDDERYKKILAIQRYLTNPVYGPYLKELGKSQTNLSTEILNKKTLAQLDKIISELRVYCRNKNSNTGLDGMLFGATHLVESTVSRATTLNMTGWTQMLQHDPGFLEAWELIKIERLSFATMSPELRFGYGLATNAMAVIAMNKMQIENQRREQIAASQAQTQNKPILTVQTPTVTVPTPTQQPVDEKKKVNTFVLGSSDFDAPPSLDKK